MRTVKNSKAIQEGSVKGNSFSRPCGPRGPLLKVSYCCWCLRFSFQRRFRQAWVSACVLIFLHRMMLAYHTHFSVSCFFPTEQNIFFYSKNISENVSRYMSGSLVLSESAECSIYGGGVISSMVPVSHPDTPLPVPPLLSHVWPVPISTSADLLCLPKFVKNKYND